MIFHSQYVVINFNKYKKGGNDEYKKNNLKNENLYFIRLYRIYNMKENQYKIIVNLYSLLNNNEIVSDTILPIDFKITNKFEINVFEYDTLQILKKNQLGL